MDDNGTIWGQAFLFLTTIIGFAFQAWRESRNRRWDQESRRSIANELTLRGAALNAKIDENTALTTTGLAASREAIKASNNFNEKLLRVTSQFDEIGVRERHRETSRIERIDNTTQETNGHVRHLAEEE